MPDSIHYLPLNPFVDASVGESHVWGQTLWRDVSEAQAGAYQILEHATRQARETGKTQIRFVRGAAGVGKSHLLARLRARSAGTILYAYVENPPFQAGALQPFVLNRVIHSLLHPARQPNGEEAGFSQLQHLALAVLRLAVEGDTTVEDLHAEWQRLSDDERLGLSVEATQLLEAEHPGIPGGLISCLLAALVIDRQQAAAQWLSGAAGIAKEALAILHLAAPLKPADAGQVIFWLGKLARQTELTIVLALDQLELNQTPEQLNEIQTLLAGLIDHSSCWVVLIALTTEHLQTWDHGFDQALRPKIGTQDGSENYLLPAADVPLLNASDQLSLIRQRLGSPQLVERRKMDRIFSTLFPFRGDDVRDLTHGGSVASRTLLAMAEERYRERLLHPWQFTPSLPSPPDPRHP